MNNAFVSNLKMKKSTETFGLKITPEEKYCLARAAEVNGVSMSRIIRHALWKFFKTQKLG
jgi:uncharacterized protein (DUF1778 family)